LEWHRTLSETAGTAFHLIAQSISNAMPNAKRVEQHNSFNVIAIASSLHKPPHSRQAQGHVSNKPSHVDQHTYAHINLAKTVGDCRRGRGWGRAERLRPDGCTTTNRKVGVR